MEREGSSHALDEMLNDEAHEEKKSDTLSRQDKDYEDQSSRLFSELQKSEQIRQQEVDKNQTALTTGERITITRNKEAQKALREWRMKFKISQAIHGDLNHGHAKEFFTWAQENGKIDFSKDKKLEKIYTKYVGELSLSEQTSEEVQEKSPDAQEEANDVSEEKEESPSIIVDYATHYKVQSEKTLANILKNKKVSTAYETWVEETGQDKKPQRLGSEKKTREFINWATQNTDIDFSKLLPEKNATPKSENNTGDKKILLKIKMNKELQPLLTEWRKLNAPDSIHLKNVSTNEDVIEFIDWVIKEKTEDISGKTYNQLERSRFDLEHGEIEEIPEEEPNIIVGPKIYEEAEKIEAAKRRISDLPTESNILGSEAKSEKLRSHRQQIQDLYGVTLDEEGDPATPKDAAKIAKMLGLIDADVQKLQRSGIFGKIKGFFQDIGASEKEKMKAYGFKKDLSEYVHFALENAQPKYGSRGPVSRSVVRERGSVGTPVGSVETARYSPIKRAVPKRGRPRKTKV